MTKVIKTRLLRLSFVKEDNNTTLVYGCVIHKTEEGFSIIVPTGVLVTEQPDIPVSINWVDAEGGAVFSPDAREDIRLKEAAEEPFTFSDGEKAYVFQRYDFSIHPLED